MNQRLEQRVIQILCEEWEHTQPGILGSETIYNRLVAEGETVSEGIMDNVLSQLRVRGLIRGILPIDREGIRRHGAVEISYVDPLLCRETH